jgi:hypothetical protein
MATTGLLPVEGAQEPARGGIPIGDDAGESNDHPAERYLQDVAQSFAQWVQFGDAKAAGVLVLLALGLTDLLRSAGSLEQAHALQSDWGVVATVSFWTACGLVVATVSLISHALFPRLKPGAKSLFYFGTVAEHPNAESYLKAIEEKSEGSLVEDRARQAWELARIADTKFRSTRRAYYVALIFLAAWSVARLTLSIAR